MLISKSHTFISTLKSRNICTLMRLNHNITVRNALIYLQTPRLYYTVSAFFLITLLSFGSGFSFDSPAALQNVILRTLKINNAEYEILYLISSWPNAIVPIIGGYLLDRVIGYRLGAILYSSSVVLGQTLFLLGCGFNFFWLMCIGRFFFGVGAENLSVAQYIYVGKWFKGRQISIVFGFMFTFARLGSILDFNVTQAIYNALSTQFGLNDNLCLSLSYVLGVCLCSLSLIFAILLAVVDKRAEKHITFSEDPTEKKNCISLKNFKFPLNIWFIFIVFICIYLVFPFITLSSAFFQSKYGYSSALSSFTVSIFFITVSLVSALNGLLVDRVGLNIAWIILGFILIVFSHSFLAFTFWPPAISAILMGYGYSIAVTALWPLPTFIIPLSQLGTAFGCSLAALSLGEGLFSIVSGVILDNFGYFSLEIFFILINLFGLFATMLLFTSDLMKGGVLNRWGPTRRKKKVESHEVTELLLESEPSKLESEDGDDTKLVVENTDGNN